MAEPGEVCGECNRRIPIPHEDKTPRKRTGKYIAVPADAENGSEVLEGLFEAAQERLAPVLGYDRDVPAYYLITAVFSDWLSGYQQSTEVIV